MALDDLVVKVGADLTGFRTSMTAMKGYAAIGAAAAAAALIGAFVSVTKAASDVGGEFEQQMVKVGAVTQATGKDFDALRAKALQLGRDTFFTATEAAKGMYDLGSAGLKAKDVISASEYAMKMAGAQGASMGQATHMLSTALIQFSLDADQSKRVTDTFTQAMNDSVLNMEKLTEGMKYAGSMGAAMGWSIEETTAALALFTNLGLEGGQAGRHLQDAMEGVSYATKRSKNALAEMGLTLADVNPQTHTFGEILKILGERQMTVTQSFEIFGRISGMNMKVLADKTREGTENWEEFVEQLHKAQEGIGATAQMYSRYMDTFKGRWEEVKGALEVLWIAIFDTFEDEATLFFKYLDRQITNLSELVIKHEEDIKYFYQQLFEAATKTAAAIAKILEVTIKLAEYAKLDSVWDTSTKAAELAKEGWLDFDKFLTASFTERQRMVQEAVKNQEAATKVMKMKNDTYLHDLVSSHKSSDGLILMSAKEATQKEIELMSKAFALEDKYNNDNLKKSIVLAAEKEKNLKKDLEAKEEALEAEQKRVKEYNEWWEKAEKAKLAEAQEDYSNYLSDKYNSWVALEHKMEHEEFWNLSARNAQLIYLNFKHIDELALGEQQRVDEVIDANQQVIDNSSLMWRSIKDGAKDAWEKAKQEQMTWYEFGTRLMNDFIKSTETLLGDVFYAVMKGNWDDIGEAFSDFCDNLVRSFANALAQMAANKTLEWLFGIGSGSGGSGSGGIIGGIIDYFSGSGSGSAASGGSSSGGGAAGAAGTGVTLASVYDKIAAKIAAEKVATSTTTTAAATETGTATGAGAAGGASLAGAAAALWIVAEGKPLDWFGGGHSYKYADWFQEKYIDPYFVPSEFGAAGGSYVVNGHQLYGSVPDAMAKNPEWWGLTSEQAAAILSQDVVVRKAKGGRVYKGRPVYVGEEGAETFVPDGNGYIYPNGHSAGNSGVGTFVFVNQGVLTESDFFKDSMRKYQDRRSQDNVKVVPLHESGLRL